jgi:integrase
MPRAETRPAGYSLTGMAATSTPSTSRRTSRPWLRTPRPRASGPTGSATQAITKMAKENVHVSVAQRIASHRNVRTTLAIYPHVTDDDLMKAAEGLNRPARAKSQS